MTPQENAMQLISKFVSLGFTLEASKECSLIAVDEMIKSWDTEFYVNCGVSRYYQEVKQEIEKL